MKYGDNRISYIRIIALVCIVSLLCPCLPSCIGPSVEDESLLSFELDSSLDAYRVVGIGEFAEKDLTIPSKHNKKSVLVIGSFAFWGCKELWSVKIEEGIELIENDAFSDCYHITKIFLPRSLKLISDYAFNSCTSLLSFYFAGTREEWTAIEKGEGWDTGTPNYTIYCSDGNVYKKK